MAWCCLTFFSNRAYQATIVAAFACDFLICLAAFLLGESSSVELQDKDRYASSTADTLACCLVRIVVLPLFAWVALKTYQRTANASPLRNLQAQESAPPPPAEEARGGMGLPLVQTSETDARELGTPGSPASSEGSARSGAQSLFEMQRDHALLMKQADKRRAIIMAVAFAGATVMSMYNGLKCVVFHYDPNLVGPQGALFGLVILLVNAEYFLLRDYLGELTKEKGEIIPHLHMHELFFELGLQCHVCDVCHESMKGPHYIAYRCRTCDFDLCPRCHKKKDDSSAKGFGARAVRRDGEQMTTWSYFRRTLDFTLEHGHMATLALVCLTLTQSMQIWAPSVQGNIFDGIIQYLSNPDADRGNFEKAMITYVAVNAFQGLFGGIKSYAQMMVLRQLACAVRMKLFQSVLRMDISFFDTMHTGQLTSRLTNDASTMVQPLNTLMNDLVANVMLLVGGCFMAFRTSWKLSILALTVVPPITFCYRQYAEWGKKVNRSIYCAQGEANSIATEAIHNIRTVRGFSTEAFETSNYEASQNVAMHHGKRSAYVGASVTMFSTYLNLGTAVLILWYGGTLVCESKGKAMSIGSLITFQLYWNMMNSAFISLGNVFNDLIRSSSAAERVVSLIDARPEVDPDAGATVEREGIKGHLQLRGVEFRYKTRPDNIVLKGIDLDVPAGTTTALVGKSGGGKSTLVHLLMRFYEPVRGSVMLDGRDMTELSSRNVRTFCGFVAQDTQLWAKSIEENLAYGLGRPYTHEEVVEACQAANAHEFIMKTEEQYETRVGERGMLLSGGQRQRLAIARCFLRKPRLLFLDEATSALDAENEGVVQDSLERLIESVGCTVVLIAHRLSTVINATQIAVVHEGAIIERGPHDELVQSGGIYAKLVERQMSRDASKVMEQVKEEPQGGRKRGGGGGQARGMQNEIDVLISEMEGNGALGNGALGS